MKNVEVKENWFANERGNTWLMDDDGNHIIYVDVTPKNRMEITIRPEDYPGFSVSMLKDSDSTDEHLSKHINQNYGGWNVRKCNIEGVELDGQMVAEISD